MKDRLNLNPMGLEWGVFEHPPTFNPFPRPQELKKGGIIISSTPGACDNSDKGLLAQLIHVDPYLTEENEVIKEDLNNHFFSLDWEALEVAHEQDEEGYNYAVSMGLRCHAVKKTND